jgi:hypothetical protein
MQTLTNEILDKALKDMAALLSAPTPNMQSLKDCLIRCIVAADCVELDVATVLTQAEARVEALERQRESFIAFLRTVDLAASSVLAEYVGAIPQPDYNETYHTRNLAATLREVGGGAKGIVETYEETRLPIVLEAVC